MLLPLPSAPAELAKNVLASQAILAPIRVREVLTPPDYVVPASARPELRRLKDQFLALLEQMFDEAGDAALARHGPALDSWLDEALKKAGIAVTPDCAALGCLSSLAVRRLGNGHERRVGVTFTVEVGIGGDDVLSVFELDASGFRRAIDVRTDDYASVTEARFASTWSVAPPDATGRWYLVDSHSRAWVSSIWRGIRYRVLEPGPRSDTPVTLLEERDSAQLGDSGAGEIQARATGFTIRYESWAQLGAEIHRTYVRAYERSPKGFVRVAPFVASPADLIAEVWLAPDASVAENMAIESARPATRKLWHAIHGTKAPSDGKVTVDGKKLGHDVPPLDLVALPNRVRIEHSCQACGGFVPRIAISAERRGEHWLIDGVQAP